MPRPLNKIAAEILTDWRPAMSNPKTRKSFHIFAKPWVEAMLELRVISDSYGLETGEGVVLYFLTNVAQWRGDTARRIKAELNAHLKEKSNAND
jgi:hypothetical protein